MRKNNSIKALLLLLLIMIKKRYNFNRYYLWMVIEMRYIDVRSDTVTQPTQAMRDAMLNAVVGDDVYDEDPTVKELERKAAELTGKEAALFVPSGTFGNQLALFTHCKRGEEVILGDDCHIVVHEVGASSVIAGVQLRTVPSIRGVIDPCEVKSRIRNGEEDMKIYYYPSCSTCKKALKWLDNSELKYEKEHIVDANLTRKEIENIYKKSKLDIKKFFNTSGKVYKELDLKNKLLNMNESEKLELLASNGMLLKRPLLVEGNKVIVGFNEKEYEEKLK